MIGLNTNPRNSTWKFRICFVVVTPMTANVFLTPHIIELSKQCEVTIICNGARDQLDSRIRQNLTVQLPIGRKISILQDVHCLIKMVRLFRKEKYDSVHSVTPKAGLLAGLAGLLARVPVRIHWFTGQVWATKYGIKRWLLKSMDRIIIICTTHQLVDSRSQRAFLIDQGVLARNRGDVLAAGSICGVDISRFRSCSSARTRIRKELGISETDTIALFVGRLQHEKGLLELAQAFLLAANKCPRLHLVLAGPDEAGMNSILKQILSPVLTRFHSVGFVNCPEQYMAASDFLVIPSHREGFGVVVIEAAACGIPSIGTNIYGLSDAIIDGDTGLLIPFNDISSLDIAMSRLALHAAERRALGRRAQIRVAAEFQQSHVVDGLVRYYKNTLTIAKE